jgi:hypothetical protein
MADKRFRAEVTGVGEMVWSTNAMRYETADEAKGWVDAVSQRWFGFDAARVVDETVPMNEAFDATDETIVLNYKR